MSPLAIVLVVLFLIMIFGGAPAVGFVSHGYGYYPSGLFLVLLIVLVILIVTKRL